MSASTSLYRRRRLVNAVAIVLACAAALFGLAFLAWILWTLLSKGLANLNLALFTQDQPPPLEAGGLRNAIVGSLLMCGMGVLVGISRVLRRPLWLPAKLRERALPAARLRPALSGGLHWVRRLEKISRPYRLRRLVDGRAQDIFNNLAFILAALLLMAPFGFIPFSNTLPGLALLFYAIGMIQRDGTAILLGHLANIGTIVYFGILIGGGGMAAHGLLRHFTG